jgi:hypothetical protein
MAQSGARLIRSTKDQAAMPPPHQEPCNWLRDSVDRARKNADPVNQDRRALRQFVFPDYTKSPVQVNS